MIGDQAAVARLVIRQRDLVRARNWTALYETYAPAERATCAKDAFIRRREAAIPNATGLTGFMVDGLRVRVDGDVAYVVYVDTLDGTQVASATDAAPDLYLRVDGNWYDKFDATSSC